jgi:hypothetical protein
LFLTSTGKDLGRFESNPSGRNTICPDKNEAPALADVHFRAGKDFQKHYLDK